MQLLFSSKTVSIFQPFSTFSYLANRSLSLSLSLSLVFSLFLSDQTETTASIVWRHQIVTAWNSFRRHFRFHLRFHFRFQFLFVIRLIVFHYAFSTISGQSGQVYCLEEFYKLFLSGFYCISSLRISSSFFVCRVETSVVLINFRDFVIFENFLPSSCASDKSSGFNKQAFVKTRSCFKLSSVSLKINHLSASKNCNLNLF